VSKLRFRFAWAFCLVTLLFIACGMEDKLPVRIAGNDWPSSQLLYQGDYLLHTAVDGGKPAEYALAMLGSTSSVMRMMRNDLVDVGIMSLDQAIAFQIDTGLELCIAQVLDYSNGADALVVRPGTDLKKGGKTINLGLNGTILSKYMLNRADDNQILDKGNIHIIFADNNIAELYFNGKIDAAITSEPQLSRLVSLGAAVVFSSADIPGEIVDVVVSKKSVSQNRTQVLNLLRDRVWAEGLLYLNTKKTDERSKINFHPNALDVAYVDNLKGIKLLTGEQSQKILKNNLNGTVDNIFSHLVEMEEYSVNQRPQLRACSSH